MRKVVSFALMFAVLMSVVISRVSVDSTASSDSQVTYAGDQILVKFKAETGAFVLAQSGTSDSLLGEGTSTAALSPAELDGSYVINLNGKMSVEDAVAQASKDPRVEYAEPNFLCYKTDTTPNDPFFGEMWGLNNSGPSTSSVKAGADISAIRAWDLTTGSEAVVVAVIDTGVYLQHVDLASNAWVNPREVRGNGLDDDGNGLVDDVNGWNFFANNNHVYTDASADGHGTHVAGTIGAVGNNGLGVTGVAWQVKLMSLKFLDKTPGAIDGAVRAINYAIEQKRRGVNVKVINASWISSGDSRALHDAIAAAGTAGILFVCAAGNGGADSIGDDNDGSPTFPASWTDLPSLISVAALDSGDNLARFSNYGRTSVTVAAPGVDILSTYPPDGSSASDSYAYMEGTSMATPHVTGIAALLAARYPALVPAEIKQRIIATVQPLPGLVGKVNASGRVNAYNALSNSIPGAERPSISALETTAKSLAVSGLGFVGAAMIVEVNGVALPSPKYDNASRLVNGTYTRMTLKLSKSEMKKMLPMGSQVMMTVFNTVTGQRSAAFSFTRN
ncbi:MAG TPA: S8 family peptidase [Blastocatellia bacterium]|nr:S8 family peptidase [Blastocatellia bacterium]